MQTDVLILAPHADDEVLGAGGLIARLSSEGKLVTVAILTGHGTKAHPLWGKNTWKKIRKEAEDSSKLLGVSKLIFRELPASCLDTEPNWKINKDVLSVIEKVKPREVYLPFEHDLHYDHSKVAYAGYVALRPYLKSSSSVCRVLAYETLSETHLRPPYFSPPFIPNVYVDISKTLQTKLRAMSAYKSQLTKTGPRSLKAIEALAHLRGEHIGVRAAEGFILLGEYLR